MDEHGHDHRRPGHRRPEGEFPCEQGQSCHLQFSGMITARQWTQLCAASLLPGAELYCVIFGP